MIASLSKNFYVGEIAITDSISVDFLDLFRLEE